VNHDLVIPLPGVSPDGNPLTYQILTLPASGVLYQYSAGSRGVPINVTNIQVNDSGGRVIFAPAPGQTGTPSALFGYLCNDGYYSSSPAVVTVDIGLPAAPQFADASWSQPSAGVEDFNFSFTGTSNATYSVWAATNLVDWVDLGTAAEVLPGDYGFVDTTVTNWPQRFYRLTAP
jgi:hypothetical protein